jgi:zinc/manganese transport system substrate-binding protein
MRKILTPALAATVLALSACGTSSDDSSTDTATETDSDLPSIVVTTSIAGDMVTAALSDLVGSELEVEVIVPVGADAHEFAPSAKQAETMENADLLVVIGLGYEEGMGDIIDNAIDAGAATFVLGVSREPDEGRDPHVWLDPVLMSNVFGAFPDAVAVATGVPIADVQVPVARYVELLTDLDATITSEFAATEPAARNLVTNHDSLSRFADRYGLTIVDTIIPSVSTSAQASAADLDKAIDAIQDNDVNAIFADSTGSDELAQALADELGRDISVIELYTESLGEPGSDADTYIGMMTVNTERVAGTLR